MRHFKNACEDLVPPQRVDVTVYEDIWNSRIQWLEPDSGKIALESYYDAYERATRVSRSSQVCRRLLMLCIHCQIHYLRHNGLYHDVDGHHKSDIARAVAKFRSSNGMTETHLQKIRTRATPWIHMVQHFGWAGIILPGPALNDV